MLYARRIICFLTCLMATWSVAASAEDFEIMGRIEVPLERASGLTKGKAVIELRGAVDTGRDKNTIFVEDKEGERLSLKLFEMLSEKQGILQLRVPNLDLNYEIDLRPSNGAQQKREDGLNTIVVCDAKGKCQTLTLQRK